jgi:hypothetical protein
VALLGQSLGCWRASKGRLCQSWGVGGGREGRLCQSWGVGGGREGRLCQSWGVGGGREGRLCQICVFGGRRMQLESLELGVGGSPNASGGPVAQRGRSRARPPRAPGACRGARWLAALASLGGDPRSSQLYGGRGLDAAGGPKVRTVAVEVADHGPEGPSPPGLPPGVADHGDPEGPSPPGLPPRVADHGDPEGPSVTELGSEMGAESGQSFACSAALSRIPRPVRGRASSAPVTELRQ